MNHGERTNKQDPMPAPEVRLALIDAAELTEALAFVSQWLCSADHDELAASFHRFIGTDDYDLTALQDDLARFTFLLGQRGGRQLVRPRRLRSAGRRES